MTCAPYEDTDQSGQSNHQSLRCPHREILGPWLSLLWRLVDAQANPCLFWEPLIRISLFLDVVYMSRDMTKPTMWLYAQRRLCSAWASAQSDQSLRCALSGVAKDPNFFHADSEDWLDWADVQADLSLRLMWVFAGRTLILLVLSCLRLIFAGRTHILLVLSCSYVLELVVRFLVMFRNTKINKWGTFSLFGTGPKSLWLLERCAVKRPGVS